MDIIAENKFKTASQFYYCLVKSVSNNKCTIDFNNKEYVVPFYGGSPKANKTYAVFLPQNNMNQAFVIGETDLESPVPISMGGTGATSASAALTNLGAIRPNLLDNWYFVGGGSQQGDGYFPINSKGQTVYTGAVMTIDRWGIVSAGTLNVKSDCVQFVSGNSASYKRWYEQLSSKVIRAGNTYTYSVLCKVNSLSGNAWIRFLYNSGVTEYKTKITNTGIQLLTVTFTALGSPANNSVEVYAGSTSSDVLDIDIYAAKVEIGNTQTLAHQENGTWVLNEVPKWVDDVIDSVGIPLPISVGGTGASTVAGVFSNFGYTEGTNYIKFPNGTMMQWGSESGKTSGDAITFPVAFYASPPLISITPAYNTTSTARCIFSMAETSSTGTNVYAFDCTTGQLSTSTTLAYRWLAIGRWKA